MLQRAAAAASEQDLWRDSTDLPQRAAEAPAAAQQRKRATVTHKLCSKCHTVKPASDFWKNKCAARAVFTLVSVSSHFELSLVMYQ